MESTLFFILISLILLIFLTVGIYPSKNDSKENFLISNRNLSGFANGFSIAASKIGAGLLVTYSTFFFLYGWPAFFYFIGIIVGYLLFYRFSLKLRDESEKYEYYTLADYFKHKYGDSVGKIVGLITTISVFGWILTNLVAGGKLLTTLTDIPVFTTTFVLSAVIGAYLFFGGFNSVIKTDKIQYIALILIALIFGLVMFNYGDSNAVFTIPDTENIPILKVIGFFLLGILFPMGSAELWQRVYASRNKVELKKSIVIAGISYVLLGLLVSFICIAILNSGADLSAISNEEKLAVGVKNIVSNISPILPIIWIMAFISAIISSADTFVYTAASSIVQDIFEIKDSKTPKKTIKNIKSVIVFILVLALIISQLGYDVKDLTIVFVGVTLVLSSLTYTSIIDKRGNINMTMFKVAGVLGVIAVIFHFVISNGNSEVVTALIGFILSFSILLIIYLFNRNKSKKPI